MVTRRELLAASAATALALASKPRGSLARTPKGSAIIVGAGLAGLAAAWELERAGWEVTVLEARRRLGGRVLTLRFPGDQHAEAGGEYLDSRHGALIDYTHRLGLELEDVRQGWGGLDDLVYRRRRRVPLGQFRGSGADARQIGRFWSRLHGMFEDVSVSQPSALRGRELDRLSVAQLMDRESVSGHARFLLETQFRDDYGVQPAALSLLFVLLAEKVAWDQPGAGVEAFRIRGGNARLADSIAARLAARPRLGAPVSRIEQSGSGVAVEALDGHRFEADQCVVTIPLPALRGIAFEPALSSALTRAASALPYATIAKTVLGYRRRFWRRRGFSGDVYSDLELGSTWEATDQQAGERGVLVSYAAGRRGRNAATRSEGARIRAATGELERIFAGSQALRGPARSVAWAGSRWSGGCWVTYAPGQTTEHWPSLHHGPSDGRVHLAGEHTERLTGYMESAIRSGRDAAARVAAY